MGGGGVKLRNTYCIQYTICNMTCGSPGGDNPWFWPDLGSGCPLRGYFAAFKPATIETGATIQVPLFIKEGDVIKVDTRTGEYSERIIK